MITTAEEFCRLRESTDPTEYGRAAVEEASLAVWREVISAKPEMRFWVVQNKTVPLEILEELVGDSDVQVRDMIARKRKISESVAVQLAKDSDEGVRAALARNPKLTAATLTLLRHDTSRLVQEALAARKDEANQRVQTTAVTHPASTTHLAPLSDP